jgi:hypothetical protein
VFQYWSFLACWSFHSNINNAELGLLLVVVRRSNRTTAWDLGYGDNSTALSQNLMEGGL